jgi:phosphatidylglycerol lysyltransferase
MKLDPRLTRLIVWLQAHQTKLTAGMTVLVLAVAALALSEILKEVRLADIEAALAAISTKQILLSIGLTALSYVVLTGYDVLALDAIGKPQRYWRAALGSFTAYCFSHNLGFAPITGAAARWRAYKGTNLTPSDIARLVVIAGVTFWLGIFVLLGAFLVSFPGALRVQDMQLAFPAQAAIGAAILLGAGLYLWACAQQMGPINILGWTLPVPTMKQALAQFALAATDIAIASAALLVLLPAEAWHHYPDFVVAYVVAIVVALITHAPGGLGVFEAVILVTLPEVDKPALVSALILYRVIYYWGPLLLAAGLLAVNEARMARVAVKARDRRAGLGQRHTL